MLPCIISFFPGNSYIPIFSHNLRLKLFPENWACMQHGVPSTLVNTRKWSVSTGFTVYYRFIYNLRGWTITCISKSNRLFMIILVDCPGTYAIVYFVWIAVSSELIAINRMVILGASLAGTIILTLAIVCFFLVRKNIPRKGSFSNLTLFYLLSYSQFIVEQPTVWLPYTDYWLRRYIWIVMTHQCETKNELIDSLACPVITWCWKFVRIFEPASL